MSFIIEFFPYIVAGISAVFAIFNQIRIKNIKLESEKIKNDSDAKIKRAESMVDQVKSTQKGNQETKELVEKANDKESISNLTSTDY